MYLSVACALPKNCLAASTRTPPSAAIQTPTNPPTTASSERTLRQDIHRIIDLNIHMIANRAQLLALRRHLLSGFRLDLVRRAAVFREAARDDDAVAVDVGPVGFVALVLEHYRYFGRAARMWCKYKGEGRGGRERGEEMGDLPLAFADEGLETVAAARRVSFAAESDGDCGEHGALATCYERQLNTPYKAKKGCSHFRYDLRTRLAICILRTRWKAYR